MSYRKYLLSLTVIGVLAAGCADDPAADAPKAEVADAAAPSAAVRSETSETYSFDNTNSSIDWVGSKVTGSHDGGFHDFSGEVTVADGQPESVDIEIDTTSIYSDNDNLTTHLNSADFFDTEQYPTATFTSTSITPDATTAGQYTVAGDLDLHGVTKNITFPATIEVLDDGVTANAEFSIKRFDWGIAYEGKADDLIRDEVLLKLDIQTAGSTESAMGEMDHEMDGEMDHEMDGEEMDGEMTDDAAAGDGADAVDGQ